ncbi:unnamed protein product [Musa hybrid cultivar]
MRVEPELAAVEQICEPEWLTLSFTGSTTSPYGPDTSIAIDDHLGLHTRK